MPGLGWEGFAGAAFVWIVYDVFKLLSKFSVKYIYIYIYIYMFFMYHIKAFVYHVKYNNPCRLCCVIKKNKIDGLFPPSLDITRRRSKNLVKHYTFNIDVASGYINCGSRNIFHLELGLG